VGKKKEKFPVPKEKNERESQTGGEKGGDSSAAEMSGELYNSASTVEEKSLERYQGREKER